MATYNKAAMQYQRNAIQTASPAKLTLMLYDGAIKFANMAIEAIDGRFVVSAKANPGLVASPSLDMDAIGKEIETIVDACHRYNCTCDLVLKDITTVGGRTENLIEWEQLAMKLVQKY